MNFIIMENNSDRTPNYFIVLLSYNHPQLTFNAAKSIEEKFKDQGHPPLILVHNGSEEKHVTYLKDSLKNFDHLILPQNTGYSGGANAGILYAIQKHSSSGRPWALFITNDCEVIEFPTTIAVEDKQFLAPIIWARNSNKIDSMGGLVDLEKGHLSHIKCMDFFEQVNNRASRNRKTYIPGTAFAIWADTFVNLGGFNELLHTYWEDVDLSLRAHQKKIQLGIIENWQIKHKIGKTCHKKSFYTTYLYQRNRRIICRFWATGSYTRLKLEFFLFISWIKLVFNFSKARKYENIKELWKAIFENVPKSDF